MLSDYIIPKNRIFVKGRRGLEIGKICLNIFRYFRKTGVAFSVIYVIMYLNHFYF